MTRPAQASSAIDGTTSTREHGQHWMELALCVQVDPETFFPDGRGAHHRPQIAEAKAVCDACPVMDDCRDWALAELPYGIAGGLTEDERRAINRRRGRRPSKVTPTVVAARPAGVTQPPRERVNNCGTANGYRDHGHRKEAVCDPCRAAKRVESNEERAAKRRARTPVDDVVTEVEFLISQGMGPDQIADAVNRKRPSLVSTLRSRGRDDLAARFLRREQAA